MEIIFQDHYLVAINKPSGLLVHRSEIDKHETRFALQMLRDQLGQRVYPLHRLDKPTSGILLFALDQGMARSLMSQFIDNEVQKYYLAIVRGYTEDCGVIDYPLVEILDKMTDRRAKPDKPAQQAITEYRTLATVELDQAVGRYNTARYSLLDLHPLTGRKHQIRRHMKHIFHPIVGDTTHGDGKHNQLVRNRFSVHRLLLHAYSLAFTHPVTKAVVTINAGLDEAFITLLKELGWSDNVPF